MGTLEVPDESNAIVQLLMGAPGITKMEFYTCINAFMSLTSRKKRFFIMLMNELNVVTMIRFLL